MARNKSLAEIADKYNLSLIFLFGSGSETGGAFLEGKEVPPLDPLADLEVGVVFGRGKFPRKPPRAYAELYVALSDLFAPFKLDLVFLQETSSLFQFEAITGVCIFAQDKAGQADYIEEVLRRGADWKPVMDKFYQELAEILREGK